MRRDALAALVAGVCLLAGALALLGLAILRGDAWRVLVVVGVELAAGRETAIPAGLATGLAWPAVALAVLLVEWCMLLLGFPLLVLLGERLARIPRLQGFFARARAYAQAHPASGVLALGGLTAAPFVPVGALTSVLVAEFLGLPSRRLVPVLLAAELLAIVSLAYLADRVLGVFPGARLVMALVALVLLLAAIASAFLGRGRAATSM